MGVHRPKDVSHAFITYILRSGHVFRTFLNSITSVNTKHRLDIRNVKEYCIENVLKREVNLIRLLSNRNFRNNNIAIVDISKNKLLKLAQTCLNPSLCLLGFHSLPLSPLF